MKNSKDIKKILVRIVSGLILTFWGAFLIGCEDCNDCRVVAVDDTPPDAPQGVYSVTGDRAVFLYWLRSPESDVDYYVVWRSEDAIEGPYERRSQVNHPSDRNVGTISFVDAPLTNGYTYFYAVTAVDKHGNESYELSREDVYDTPRPEGSGVVVYDVGTHPAASGFDFRNSQVRAWDDDLADIYFEYDADWNSFFVWAKTFDQGWTDIQDFGFTESLDELGWAPTEGWSKVGWLEAIDGHSYYIWTAEENFAKFRIDATDSRNKSLTISWAYQTEVGNPELVPSRPEHDPAFGTKAAFVSFSDSK